MIRIYQSVRSAGGKAEQIFDRNLAWPRLMLYDPQTREFIGFVMNRLDLRGAMKIDDFFDDDMRGLKSWDSRLSVSRRIAEIVEFLNQNDIVVGDNHGGNIFVLPDGECAFVDCDSFQIGKQFPINALQGEIAPPEVSQSRILETTSDTFTTCFLVYRLLMDGFNPFAHVRKHGPELTYEDIKAKGLAPVRDASLPLPPNSPPLDRLPVKLRSILGQGLDPNPQNRVHVIRLITALEEAKKEAPRPKLAANPGRGAAPIAKIKQAVKQTAHTIAAANTTTPNSPRPANNVWAPSARSTLRKFLQQQQPISWTKPAKVACGIIAIMILLWLLVLVSAAVYRGCSTVALQPNPEAQKSADQGSEAPQIQQQPEQKPTVTEEQRTYSRSRERNTINTLVRQVPYDATVLGKNVNFRSQPRTGHKEEVIGKLNEGDFVQVLEVQGKWFKVQVGDLTGWVYAAHLKVDGLRPVGIGKTTTKQGAYASPTDADPFTTIPADQHIAIKGYCDAWAVIVWPPDEGEAYVPRESLEERVVPPSQ